MPTPATPRHAPRLTRRPSGPPGTAARPSPARASLAARVSRPAGATLSARGQASVEFVVLLPVILVVLAAAYQALLAGQTLWEVRVAARAAARAQALGSDARAAARTHLRSRLERGLRVSASDAGDVRVSVRIPAVLPALGLGRVSATSHFRPQSG